MNKTLKIVLLIVALGVVAAVGYYFGFDYGWEKSVDQAGQSDAFSENGILTRNSAHVSEPWFIEYEKNGQELRERLGFEGDAMCSRESENVSCADFGFRANDQVQVEGRRVNDYIAVKRMHVVASAPEPSVNDTFKETKEYGFYGTITLTGYIDIQKRVCNPGDMCGETVDYASFVFNSDNEALKKFTGTMDGNSFIAGNKVGIGCLRSADSRIVYENDADIGWKSGEISGSDYTKKKKKKKQSS
ncbi:MAG: hypothetical protein KW793_03100 [Candidatus Doudnabacteria bacterium]|nr:hypothetical protein [Candidatus Doudnabacteria bacterium]